MDVEALRPNLRRVFAATRLRTDPEIDFVLVRLPPGSYHALLTALAPLHDPRFQAVVREPGEVTLIAPQDLWARISRHFPAATVDAPWRLITLDITIPLDVYGYLEQVARICAAEGASVIVAGAYSTDHLLIHAAHAAAVEAHLQRFVDACAAAAG